MILNTIRKIDNDQSKELAHGDDASLKENLAVGFLNPEDYNELKLSPKSHIKVTSEFGSVILKANQEKNVPHMVLNVPISIWINQITGIKENRLIFKNLKVNVESTDEIILNFEEILNKIKEN